jgi:hypothetical protein
MRTTLQIIGALALCVIVLGVNRVAVAQQIVVDYTSKFDEFYGSDWESAMGHLDNFALQMQNSPHMIGVLIVYGGQRGRRGESRAWSSCLKSYLVTRRGIERKQIVMIDGGYREDLTVELWVTADRKHMPDPVPLVKPKDVRFRKGRVIRMCEI